LGEQVAKFQRAKLQFIKYVYRKVSCAQFILYVYRLAKAYKQKKGFSETQDTVFEKELLLQDKREQISIPIHSTIHTL
jgi:hypothetical protein